MTKIVKYSVAMALILGALYIVSQVFFMHYYLVYKIPFGRVDVDNYMSKFIERGADDASHALIYITGDAASKLVDVNLFFTMLIPMLSCVILPFVVFMFMLYFSKDIETAFVGMVFYIIGTYSMQAFMISAYWAQLYATIFFYIVVVMLEEYRKSGNRYCLVISMICAILMFVSHMKFAGALVIYFLCRAIINKKKFMVGFYLCMIIGGLVLYPNVLLNDYPIKMGVDYVLGKFLMPLLWIMFLISVFVYPKGLTNSDKALALFAGAVFILSSTSALWRPLISVLPIFVFYSIRCLMALRSRKMFYYPAVVVLVLISLMYSYTITLYALNSMLGEMVPGTFELTYRDMDPNPFLHMFSNGNITVHRTTGFVSDFGWTAPETDEVLYGPN